MRWCIASVTPIPRHQLFFDSFTVVRLPIMISDGSTWNCTGEMVCHPDTRTMGAAWALIARKIDLGDIFADVKIIHVSTKCEHKMVQKLYMVLIGCCQLSSKQRKQWEAWHILSHFENHHTISWKRWNVVLPWLHSQKAWCLFNPLLTTLQDRRHESHPKFFNNHEESWSLCCCWFVIVTLLKW